MTNQGLFLSLKPTRDSDAESLPYPQDEVQGLRMPDMLGIRRVLSEFQMDLSECA